MSTLPGFTKIGGGVTKFSELEVDQTFDEAMHHLNQKAEDPEQFQWNFYGLCASQKYNDESVSTSCSVYLNDDVGYVFQADTSYIVDSMSMSTSILISPMEGMDFRYKFSEDNIAQVKYYNTCNALGLEMGNNMRIFSLEGMEDMDDSSSLLDVSIDISNGIHVNQHSYGFKDLVTTEQIKPLLHMNAKSFDHYHQIVRWDGAPLERVPRDSVYLIHFTGEGNEKYYYDADYDALKEEEEEVGDKRFALYHYSTDGQSNPYLELVQIKGIPTYPLDIGVQFHLSDTGQWMTLTGILGQEEDPVLGLIPEIPISVQEIHHYILNYDDTFGTEMGDVYLHKMENLTSISDSFLGTTSGTIYVTETQLQKLLTDQWIKLVEGTSDEYVMSENPKVLVKLAPIDEIVVGE